MQPADDLKDVDDDASSDSEPLLLETLTVCAFGVYQNEATVDVCLATRAGVDVVLTVTQDFEQGNYLWAGSIALSEFILQHCPPLCTTTGRRKTAVEIGAGLGLPSIALAAAGWDVVCTDTAEVLPILRDAVQRNAASFKAGGGSVSVREFDICDVARVGELAAMSTAGYYDVVLISEVVYITGLHHPVLELLQGLQRISVDRGAGEVLAYVAWQERGFEKAFFALVEDSGGCREDVQTTTRPTHESYDGLEAHEYSWPAVVTKCIVKDSEQSMQ